MSAVREVRDAEFFHVNRIVPYLSPIPPLLKAGDVLNIGKTATPFWKFYETYERRYGVDTPTGQVQVSALAFLRQVREGKIQSNALPVIADEVARHFAMLSRELLWELVRREVAPSAPSRQTCLWLAPDAAGARFWQRRMECARGTSQVVRLSVTGRVLVADASLLLADSERFDLTLRKARDYWNGVSGASPEAEEEILFEGEARVAEIQSCDSAGEAGTTLTGPGQNKTAP